MGRILYKIAAVILAAVLSAIMVSMMWMGGSISFSDFLNAGRVYDVSEKALHAPTDTFYYLKKTGEFFLTGDKRAVKKVTLDGAEREWNYLYLEIGSMSVQKLEAELRYYGKESGLVYQQPIVLAVGENIIELEEGLAVSRLGICIREAGGERFSIVSMQVREKERLTIPEDIWNVFGISFAVVFVLGSILCFCIRPRGPRPEEGMVSVYLCGSVCRGMKRLFRGSYTPEGRRRRQCVVFVLLFLSCIVWNVTGWSTDGMGYRYCYLVCGLLLLAAGFFCGGNDIQAVSFHAPVPCAWLLLWVWLMISDFWTTAAIHYHEYVMAGAAGFLLYMWAQEEDAEQVFAVMAGALKIVFFLSISVCLFFRPDDVKTPYGGIFRTPEDGAMFALLMLVTFLTGFDRAAEILPREKRRFLWDIPGILLSLYLVYRTENRMAELLGVCVMLLFLIRMAAAGKQYFLFLRKRPFMFLISIAAGILAVGGFGIGTQYIPQATGVVLRYAEESEPDEGEQTYEKEQTDEEEPDNEKQEEPDKERIVNESYLRRLNFYGNAASVRVFRKNAAPENGYLFLAYRYGIFVLLPLLLYQFAVLAAGLAGFWKDRKKLWMLGIMAVYVVFCIRGGAKQPFAHPLWLCVYLCPGIGFIKS